MSLTTACLRHGAQARSGHQYAMLRWTGESNSCAQVSVHNANVARASHCSLQAYHASVLVVPNNCGAGPWCLAINEHSCTPRRLKIIGPRNSAPYKELCDLRSDAARGRARQWWRPQNQRSPRALQNRWGFPGRSNSVRQLYKQCRRLGMGCWHIQTRSSGSYRLLILLRSSFSNLAIFVELLHWCSSLHLLIVMLCVSGSSGRRIVELIYIVKQTCLPCRGILYYVHRCVRRVVVMPYTN